MLSIIIAVSVTTIGFFGLQHQKLLTDMTTVINDTEKINILDRGTSDNQTRLILKNITITMEQYFDTLDSKLDRLEGIQSRIHNDIQQLVERSNDELNTTSRIIDSKHFE